MAAALAHRGPDSEGFWDRQNVALAHRRLSVIDLSTDGQQPMSTVDGRYLLVFNGEIYNFETLRAQLSDVRWRGHSDTEVLLAALARWGVEKTLPQLVGMFAFAFFDVQARQLWLVRDRLGIKPLYYGWDGKQFLFGSELSALEAGFCKRPTISRDALALMMRHNHVPAPHCIYQRCYKLLPGSVLQVAVDQPAAGLAVAAERAPESYWSPAVALQAAPVERDDREWQQAFHEQLRAAVRTRLVSDVPLGAFLSGGIDSTLVVALMQEQSSAPVKTFTIGFEDRALNEAEHARRTAEHLGTDHQELYLNEGHVLEAVAALPRLSDEPFADQSILPTYLLCGMARQEVTVALSGDGGDEILWGYARYPAAERMERLRTRLPAFVRPLAASVLGHPLLAATLGSLPTPAALGRPSRLDDKLQMAASMLRLGSNDELYRVLMSHWKDPEELIMGAREPATVYSNPPAWLAPLPFWKRMGVLDLLAYLPDDCLTKVDRASMAVGLEARVPLLDHRVVEMAYQLPTHLVREQGAGKVMLRRILDEYVPRALMERPKAGFGVPLGSWLRGPLKDWSNDLLSERALTDTELFNVPMVRSLLKAHQTGESDWSAYLWDVLMFQQWHSTRRSAAGS